MVFSTDYLLWWIWLIFLPIFRIYMICCDQGYNYTLKGTNNELWILIRLLYWFHGFDVWGKLESMEFWQYLDNVTHPDIKEEETSHSL